MTGFGGWVRRFLGLLLEPDRALALLRGQWYRLYFPMRGVRLRVGSRLHAYGRIKIRGGATVEIGNLATLRGTLRIDGPGKVVIGDQFESGGEFHIQGDGEVVIGNGVAIIQGLQIRGPGRVVLGEGVIVWESSVLRTHTREARIAIGDRTRMLRAYFSCAREILVGQECIIAPAKILDTDFHSIRANRHSKDSLVRVAPVRLGDNVWIGERAAVLAGTKIGKNSVVGFAAVCMREYPDNVILLGNPARVSAPIPTTAEAEPRVQGTETIKDLYVTRGYLTGSHMI